MKYPKFLDDNGVIGVVAPSFSTFGEPYTSRYYSAIEEFNKRGHKVISVDNIVSKQIRFINNHKVKAKDLVNFYLDSKSDVLFSVAGGEFMCDTISHVNFNKIKKAEPKWYMGFSDNTNFTFLLTTLCDTASIYGDCFPEFGIKPWYKTQEDAYKFLKGEKLVFTNLDKYEVESFKREPGRELESYNLEKESKWINLSKEDTFKVEGRVLVGCLDILVMLCGTKFDKVKEFTTKYKDDGIIWFLESCDLTTPSQLRAMWQLKNAGWFNNAKAIIVGRPKITETTVGLNYKRANYKELKELNIPVVIDADFGHTAPRIPVICGAYCKLDYNKGKCKMEYVLK